MNEETPPKYRITEVSGGPYILNAYQIEALRDFSDVKKGDRGGFISNCSRLSHSDDSWIYDNALVFGNSSVGFDSKIKGTACVMGSDIRYTDVEDRAVVTHSEIFGKIDNRSRIGGSVVITQCQIHYDIDVSEFAFLHECRIRTHHGPIKIKGNAFIIKTKIEWTSSPLTITENARIMNADIDKWGDYRELRPDIIKGDMIVGNERRELCLYGDRSWTPISHEVVLKPKQK